MLLGDGTGRVEQTVIQVFEELGAAVRHEDLSRSVLLSDGCYCGHAFRSSGLRAVWFPEVNELKFYSVDGPLLRAVQLEDEMTRRPVAA